MPKQQTNIDSFFGSAAGTKKKKNPQTRLDSFFGKKKGKDAPPGAQEEKENSKSKRPSDALANDAASNDNNDNDNNNNNDNDNNNEKQVDTLKKFKKSKISENEKRRRRVIDDDSDSDEEMVNADASPTDADMTAASLEKEKGSIDETPASNDDTTQRSDEKVTAATSAKPKSSTKETTENAKPKSTTKKATKNATPKSTNETAENAKPKSSKKATEKASPNSTETKEKETSKSTTKKATETMASKSTKASKEKETTKTTMETKEKATSKSTTKEATEETATTQNTASSMPYSSLCEAFEKIEAITGRLQIQEIITNLFREQINAGHPENLYPLLYLCSNSVAPAYECVELGIGDAILIKSIAEAYGTKTESIKEKYETLGDLGSIAQTCKGKQKTLGGFFTSKSGAKKPLECQEILSTFREIANMKGNQSQKWKTEKIKKLLVRATHAAEPKYIIRALQGKLRIGLASSTVLISLAHALALSVPTKAAEKQAEYDMNGKNKFKTPDDYPEEALEYCDKKTSQEKRLEAAVAIIKKAYSEVPSFDALLDAALTVPLQDLHKACTLTPGIPVSPMLAKPTKSILEVLKRLSGQRFTCEYKYDGERCQVHMLPNGKTKVFSRNLLDTSEKFPEVPLYVKEAASDDVESCVCDAEVVAYDSSKERLVPFQVLSTRKKTEESAETAKVQVIVQVFDLVYLNGKSLLGRTLQERRDLLHKHFSVVPGKFKFAVSLDHTENGDTTVIEQFLDEAVKGQCEGLMIKTLDVNANYEPSRRSLNWLKLKKDYLEGLGDSVDLVPIGAYYGKGKRTGVYGAYLLACYDPDTEEFQSVCKIGTGFSDQDLKSLAETLNQHIIPTKTSQYNVTDQLECDVWFNCVQVWEVKAADLSKSSAHRGAIGKTGEPGRGIGLRFPRFERIREDKKPEEATTSEQILDMYYNQDSVNENGGMDADDGI